MRHADQSPPRRRALTGSLCSKRSVIRLMNIPFQRLNAIVKGRRGVSADTALLQAKWDLWHAPRARGQRPQVKPLPRTA